MMPRDPRDHSLVLVNDRLLLLTPTAGHAFCCFLSLCLCLYCVVYIYMQGDPQGRPERIAVGRGRASFGMGRHRPVGEARQLFPSHRPPVRVVQLPRSMPGVSNKGELNLRCAYLVVRSRCTCRRSGSGGGGGDLCVCVCVFLPLKWPNGNLSWLI